MNETSRIITGTVMVVVGLGLMGIPFFAGLGGFVAWIYGLPILIIGFFILFNEKEDSIEQIKTFDKMQNVKGGKK